MQTIEAIQRRMRNAEDLLSIVKTMKTLAAVNIRQYDKAVQALAEYYHAVELGFQILLRHTPEEAPSGRVRKQSSTGIVIFGSDQGMCGQFNEQVATFTTSQLENLGILGRERQILALGLRLAAVLNAADEEMDDAWLIPGSVAGIAPLIQDMVLKIDDWRAQQGITTVLLFYNRPFQGVLYRPHQVNLLPVERKNFKHLSERTWDSRTLPTYTMEWQQLFSALLRQYLFVSLYRAFAESLMSENASRLSTMQSAERNIKEHMENLNALFHQQRQQMITAELLDIVSGFEALIPAKHN